MPTLLNNQASVQYDYAGAQAPSTANSNTTTTTLLDEYSLLATKEALISSFRPGENITYVVRIVNNGRGDLYSVTVNDNLGGLPSGVYPLTYLTGSARVYINGSAGVAVTPVIASGSLTFELSNPLTPGSSAIIVYMAQVNTALPVSVNTITNTAEVTASGGSTTGQIVKASPAPTATISREAYADLSIYKAADKVSVTSGDTLTYTFTLTNTGTEAASDVVLTDNFAPNFTINSVSVTSNGVTVNYPASEYDVANNTITLPNATGTPIIVPAATSAGSGITTITIVGTVSA